MVELQQNPSLLGRAFRVAPTFFVLALIASTLTATPSSALAATGYANAIAQSAFQALPIGQIEVVREVPNGVRVAGWSMDPDSRRPNGVHVYIDGKFAAYQRAANERPDVESVHNNGSRHGYDMTLPIGDGRHKVCVHGLNKGPGLNARLGCKVVWINPGTAKPIGNIDSVQLNGSNALISGWVLDRDTSDSIAVHIYVDGAFHSGKKASGRRDDVAAVHGRGPFHGFGATVALADGRHRICVYAIDHARLRGNTVQVGCRNVTVGGGTGDGPGVIVSSTGVVMPVLQTRADGSRVLLTPCLNEIVSTRGNFVRGADVVIDPGHGGREPGAVASNGLIEKNLNLVIALKLQDILQARGYSVVLTRTSDIRLPLLFRGEIANALEPQVFVSVHHNGGALRRSSDPGTEVFTQNGSSESRRLGGILYEEIHGALSRYDAQWVDTVRQGVNTRLNADGEDLYGIHRYTPDVVSVITEAGYLSNASEAALFATAEVQDAEAVALADGIVRFLTTDDPGSRFNGSFTDPTSSGTGGTDNCTDPDLG